MAQLLLSDDASARAAPAAPPYLRRWHLLRRGRRQLRALRQARRVLALRDELRLMAAWGAWRRRTEVRRPGNRGPGSDLNWPGYCPGLRKELTIGFYSYVCSISNTHTVYVYIYIYIYSDIYKDDVFVFLRFSVLRMVRSMDCETRVSLQSPRRERERELPQHEAGGVCFLGFLGHGRKVGTSRSLHNDPRLLSLAKGDMP